MSDELIFDSERQAFRDRKKRWLIPLLVLAGILLAVVVVSLLLRSSKKPVNKGGEDTLYPFTWQVQADGSVLLELPHADARDHCWVQTDGEAYPAVRTETRGENNGSSSFLLTPAQAGRALLEFTLRKDAEAGAQDPKTDDVYRLSLLVEVAEEGGKRGVSVLNASGVQLQGEIAGGQDSENAYRVFLDEHGYLVIAVKVAETEMDWDYEIVSGQSSVTDLGMVYEADEVLLYLKAGDASGEGEVVLRSEQAAAELRFRCAVQDDGSLLVTHHEAAYGEKPAQEEFIPATEVPGGSDTPNPSDYDAKQTEAVTKETAPAETTTQAREIP